MNNPNYSSQEASESVNYHPTELPEDPFFPEYQIGVCIPKSISYIPEVKQEPVVFTESSTLNENEVREILASYVSIKCCYGKGPVKNLKIIEMLSTNTFQYTLETFTETRRTTYISEPLSNNNFIENNMMPKQPWDIPVTPSQMFLDQIVKIEIPNSSRIQMCKRCHGRGHCICSLCNGRGSKNCFHCSGSGRNRLDNTKNCFSCNGMGDKPCRGCSRTGYKICNKCAGSGRLRWYLQLIVEFKNNRDDYFSKSEFIPDEELIKCTSSTIFSNTNPRVLPITNHPNIFVNEASSRLINQHHSKFTQSKILSQRHEIKAIPVTTVKHSYKNKNV